MYIYIYIYRYATYAEDISICAPGVSAVRRLFIGDEAK